MKLEDVRVLVVENESTQRELIRYKLQQVGVSEVREAQNGMEALSLLHDNDFDILITDLAMPEMDGMRLMRHLRNKHSRPRILVVGCDDAALLRAVKKFAREVNLNIHDCVPKPLKDFELIDVLTAALRDTQVLAPDDEPANRISINVKEALGEGQFYAVYQPKMSVVTNMMIGVEALARVRDHRHGEIAPATFLPQVIEQGQIGALTYGILHHAAKGQAQWAEHGHDIAISVNVPASVIEDEHAVEQLINAVRSAGGRPAGVTLEITETGPVADMGAFFYGAAQIRMAGFGMAIDDFGIGYNSLEMLVNGPFTELKIDRSFVHDAARSGEIRAALDFCARIGKRLGMTVTAEGVESMADLAQACRAGCDLVQGFLVGRPVSAANIPALAQRKLW
ncbi:EAL domain-containing protein [Paraburkholderia fungorum]|nr:EAL domain-containing response regulator [Paraburkholderia fungorum]